jgi:hypothetical protein
MNNRLSFPLILSFSQGEKELSPLSLWERAEGEGSPKFYKRYLLRNIVLRLNLSEIQKS